MQIILDRVGKCDGCIHFTGRWDANTPCGGCERNPKIKNLRDSYTKPKALVHEVRKGLPIGPQDPQAVEMEQANDAAMGEFGVRPAAERRAIRKQAEEGPKDGGASSV